MKMTEESYREQRVRDTLDKNIKLTNQVRSLVASIEDAYILLRVAPFRLTDDASTEDRTLWENAASSWFQRARQLLMEQDK